MNLLIYHPTNQPAKDIESLAEAYILKGYNVYLLTHAEKGMLHDNFKAIGGKAFSVNKFSGFYYIKQIAYLTGFCKEFKIDVVYSNLQQCSIISIIAQYFVKSKFIIYRHHSDSVQLFGSWKEKCIDYLINLLSEHIIVISKYSYKQIIDEEKTNPKKVSLIPLGYNFENFPKPDVNNIDLIKRKYPSSLLVIIVGRLIPLKRIDIAINVLARLVEEKKDVKLLIAGTGVLENELRGLINKKDLSNNVFFVGHVPNIEDYIGASDLLIHTSWSEASCHMPKESGILGKPVIVCDQVGDFSDYIINDFNGILISKENTGEELLNHLINIYNNKTVLNSLGKCLKETVEEKFDITNIFAKHEELVRRIITK